MPDKDWRTQLAEAKQRLQAAEAEAVAPPQAAPPPLLIDESFHSDAIPIGAGDRPEDWEWRAERFEQHTAWRPRVLHRQYLAVRGLPYAGSGIQSSEERRRDRCYRCHHGVDSHIHALCAVCTRRRIICPECGACGCGYSDGESGASDPILDEAIKDDLDLWIVREGDTIVFPFDLAGRQMERTERLEFYTEYLRTPTWRRKRDGALRNAAYRCERCGDRRHLQVHHKTYDRVGGRELPADLEALCELCHYTHHFPGALAFLAYGSGPAPNASST
jgi:hypothetical protein